MVSVISFIMANDSMDTYNKISKYCLEHGYECRHGNKTIDNDLVETDHCGLWVCCKVHSHLNDGSLRTLMYMTSAQ